MFSISLDFIAGHAVPVLAPVGREYPRIEEPTPGKIDKDVLRRRMMTHLPPPDLPLPPRPRDLYPHLSDLVHRSGHGESY